MASLVGGEELKCVKVYWDCQQNDKAMRNLKSLNEARLGYQYETLTVRYDSRGDTTHFRIRAGQRVRGLAAIEKVLSPEEFADICEISFNQDDNVSFCDLAADPPILGIVLVSPNRASVGKEEVRLLLAVEQNFVAFRPINHDNDTFAPDEFFVGAVVRAENDFNSFVKHCYDSQFRVNRKHSDFLCACSSPHT